MYIEIALSIVSHSKALFFEKGSYVRKCPLQYIFIWMLLLWYIIFVLIAPD